MLQWNKLSCKNIGRLIITKSLCLHLAKACCTNIIGYIETLRESWKIHLKELLNSVNDHWNNGVHASEQKFTNQHENSQLGHLTISIFQSIEQCFLAKNSNRMIGVKLMKMLPDSTRADSRAFKRKWQNWQIDKFIRKIHRSF